GTHLCVPAREGVVPVQVLAWPLGETDDPPAVLRRRRQERQEWEERLARGEAGIGDDPWCFEPVVAVHQERGRSLDVRTDRAGGVEDLPWLKALPLPEELEGC